MRGRFEFAGVRSFLLKLGAFFLTVFVLDLVIGSFLKKAYFKQQSGYDYLTTYSIDQTRADLLFFGSSRAVNLFDTRIFEERTGLTSFNAGRYGEPVFYHWAVLKAVLKRHKPKIAILSVDAGNFSINSEAYDRLSVLLPYYGDHPEIEPIIRLKGRYEKLKLFSRIYPYNSLLLPIITGNTAYSKKKYPHINGFIPISKTFAGPLQTFDYSKEEQLDTVKINAYTSFLKECQAAGVQLYVVCPPYMINAVGTDLSITTAIQIAGEQKVPFLDYSRDSFFVSRRELFADFRHLNAKGVTLFSNLIADHLPAKAGNPKTGQ